MNWINFFVIARSKRKSESTRHLGESEEGRKGRKEDLTFFYHCAPGTLTYGSPAHTLDLDDGACFDECLLARLLVVGFPGVSVHGGDGS